MNSFTEDVGYQKLILRSKDYHEDKKKSLEKQISEFSQKYQEF